ncbi:MAG: cyclase family protein [bacterium]
MQIIDLSLALKGYGPEPDPPKIKYMSHKTGAFLLGLGALLCKSNSFIGHLKNFILYLIGNYRITSKDFPDQMGIALEEIKTDTHAGTHLDAPWHFGPTAENKPAKTIGEVPLQWCYSDGVVLDLRHKKAGEFITIEDIKSALQKINYQIKPDDIVLIMTGWDKFQDSKEYLNHPGMSEEATLWLIEQGVKIMGIDAFGFDRGWQAMFDDYIKTKDAKYLWPAHFVGRKKEYCHIEKMANLDKIPKPYGFKVICFPVNIEKAGAGWTRAVAIIE